MKKIILSIVAISFLFSGVASAQMGMMGNYWYRDASSSWSIDVSGLELLVQNIFQSQNVSDRSQVECNKVTDAQFEELGDAYMEVMIGNEAQHEVMDEMMGGEGSASLRQAHINMGRSYLGCWSDYNAGPVFMPMMYGGWGGMMGNGYSNQSSYSGWPFGLGIIGGIGIALWVIFWILIITFIIIAIRKIFGFSHQHGRALGILKERYAKGEIDTKEFEERVNMLR